MASRSIFKFKNCLVSYLRIRTIMTSEFNLKNIEKELEKNPFFDKYQKKIQILRKEKPGEYQAKILANEKVKKSKSDDKKTTVHYPEAKCEQSNVGSQKKTLDNILKLKMIENKTKEEIETIWNEYHKGKDVLYSTYSNDQYEKLNKNYIKYPTFVFPIPRGDGYEFFLFQYKNNELHFTPMIQYKKHGSNSPECLYVVYFTELTDKNLILMKGEFDKNVISPLESQYLLNVTHMFYKGDTDKHIDLLGTFNQDPNNFKYVEIISEVERAGFNFQLK